jgi:signal transduction histidine kinase
MAHAPAVLDEPRARKEPSPEPLPDPAAAPSLKQVERRRVELWTVSLVLLMGVAGLTALWWSGRSLLPPALRLEGLQSWIATVLVAGLAVAFLIYVGEKERNLRRLTRALIEERVHSASLRRLVETERASVARLEELDRLKNDFVAMVSHDLRTPLTAIIGATKTVARKGPSMDEEQQAMFMNMIQRQADRLLRLVEEVLTASEMEVAQPVVKRDEVDLRALVDDLVEDFSHTELGAGRLVIVGADPDRPRVWADPRALEQILTNLIENALKYSEAEVRVRVIARTGEVMVEVADRGPGMTAEQVATIFERFRQLQPTRRAEGGFGLGLFIVKNLVEAHNGHVEVWSEPGSGTRFTVHLPQRAARRASLS